MKIMNRRSFIGRLAAAAGAALAPLPAWAAGSRAHSVRADTITVILPPAPAEGDSLTVSYEEGSPSLRFEGSYGVATARYRRVGRMVHVEIVAFPSSKVGRLPCP